MNDIVKKIDPEEIHDKVLQMEDEIKPVITKVKAAVKTYNAKNHDDNEDSIARIEALEYFRNEITPVIEWIDRYHRLSVELRDYFIGKAVEKAQVVKQYIPSLNGPKHEDIVVLEGLKTNELTEDLIRDICSNNKHLRSTNTYKQMTIEQLQESIKVLKSEKTYDRECEEWKNDAIRYKSMLDNITLFDWFKVKIMGKLITAYKE